MNILSTNIASRNIKRRLVQALSIIAGNACLAFAIAAFIEPSGVIVGGVTGLAMLIGPYVPLELADLILIFNVGFLIFGYFALGKKFFIGTVASSLIYPVMLKILQRIPGIELFACDSFIASIFGGALVGLAIGLVMRVGASTGGVDALNLAMNKWFHMPVSVTVYLTDFIILIALTFSKDITAIQYGILLIVVESFALDKVMLLGQSQIEIFAITDKYEQVREKILLELGAGVSLIEMETGVTRTKQKGVFCIIPNRKLYDANQLIQSIDPEAFITISQVKEVRGRGFTVERKYANIDNVSNN